MKRLSLKSAAALSVSILLCQMAGIIGSFFTRASVDTWYTSLRKPFFTPPNRVFAPVWITLYLMMGISAFLVWHTGVSSKELRGVLFIFAVQLVLNSVWSIAFFGLQSIVAGLAVIIALWLMIILTTLKFARISLPAAILLIPYLLWVTFAAMLNGFIYFLNI